MHGKLLTWYDENRRTLPWRALPGQRANPYHVYLSEVMLQQTTVATVINYFNRFVGKWPTIEHLSRASLDEILVEWQGLGYYSRAKNLKSSVDKMVDENHFPKSFEELLLYPGIGDYTSKAVSSICFGEEVVPVDGNVIRVFSRLFNMFKPLPALKKDIICKTQSVGSGDRSGDFAQALMDLGSAICKPKNPKCSACPLNMQCEGYKNNTHLTLPVRPKKAKKPVRYGAAYIVKSLGQIVIEKRPEKGLLANLWGVPTSDWLVLEQGTETMPSLGLNKVVKHVFTHFTLHLSVGFIEVQPWEKFILKANQKLVPLDQLHRYALPTLMKKVLSTGMPIDYLEK